MTEDPSEDWRGEGGGRMLGVVQILVHVSKEKDVGEAERAYKRGPFKRW
jgi:hypothetical protein